MTDEKDWKVEGSGPIWIPVLEEIGVKYLLPPGLLSRVAFQESSFIETIIRGEQRGYDSPH